MSRRARKWDFVIFRVGGKYGEGQSERGKKSEELKPVMVWKEKGSRGTRAEYRKPEAALSSAGVAETSSSSNSPGKTRACETYSTENVSAAVIELMRHGT